jgi:putative transposase
VTTNFKLNDGFLLVNSISYISFGFGRSAEVKKELWGGEFWEDGYFARTVGDKVTADVIRKYIQYHREQERSPTQLELF